MNDDDLEGASHASLVLSNPLILPLVPVELRPAVTLAVRLNDHLAMQARGRGEPVLRQIRLNWWANELTALTLNDTRPDPLLTEVAAGLLPHVNAGALENLAQNWATGVDADDPALIEARGAALFDIWHQILGSDKDGIYVQEAALAAGRGWAMAEEAAFRAGERLAEALWLTAYRTLAPIRLARLPRALAALTGVTRHVAQRQGARQPRREQGVILRIGLLGR